MIPYCILASASPRRRELMTQAGFSFGVMPGKKEEQLPPAPPEEAVKALSRQKAEEIADRISAGERTPLEPVSVGAPFFIIGADTIVAWADQILGKPKSEEDAFRTLSMLSGHTHQVYTGVTVLSCQKDVDSIRVKTRIQFAEKTDVSVYPMTEDEIRSYIATKDCMDKAGSYGIQGPFAIHIREIAGDYCNVVGLPIARLYQEIRRLPY